jgi:hypothetical protein
VLVLDSTSTFVKGEDGKVLVLKVENPSNAHDNNKNQASQTWIRQ